MQKNILLIDTSMKKIKIRILKGQYYRDYSGL